MIIYRGMDLTAAPDLAQQFLASAQNSLQTGEPLLLAGYTLCTIDPDAEFFGNVRMTIKAVSVVLVGETEALLNCDTGVAVRDIRQGPTGWEILAEEVAPAPQEMAPEQGVEQAPPEPGQKSMRKQVKAKIPAIGSRVRARPNINEIDDRLVDGTDYVIENDILRPSTGAEIAEMEEQVGELIGHDGSVYRVRTASPYSDVIQDTDYLADMTDLDELPPEEPIQKRLKALRRKWLGKAKQRGPQVGQRVRVTPTVDRIDDYRQHYAPGRESRMTIAEIAARDQFDATYDGRDANNNHVIIDEIGPLAVDPSHADLEPLND